MQDKVQGLAAQACTGDQLVKEADKAKGTASSTDCEDSITLETMSVDGGGRHVEERANAIQLGAPQSPLAPRAVAGRLEEKQRFRVADRNNGECVCGLLPLNGNQHALLAEKVGGGRPLFGHWGCRMADAHGDAKEVWAQRLNTNTSVPPKPAAQKPSVNDVTYPQGQTREEEDEAWEKVDACSKVEEEADECMKPAPDRKCWSGGLQRDPSNCRADSKNSAEDAPESNPARQKPVWCLKRCRHGQQDNDKNKGSHNCGEEPSGCLGSCTVEDVEAEAKRLHREHCKREQAV